MSWFDAAGLTSFAKNALKEAQKQIDKALDIQEDELLAQQGETSRITNSVDAIATLLRIIMVCPSLGLYYSGDLI